MASSGQLVLAAIIGLIMIIALVFANMGAADITKIRPNGGSYKKVPELKRAHKMLTWLSVAGWIVVVLLGLIIFASYFFSGSPAQGNKTSFMADAFIFALLGVSLTIGILGVMAAQNLKRAQQDTSNNIDPEDPKYVKARKDCIVAASLGISGIGLVIILLIAKGISKHSKKKEEQLESEEKKIEENEEKQEESQTMPDSMSPRSEAKTTLE